jgi:hypothetical protein
MKRIVGLLVALCGGLCLLIALSGCSGDGGGDNNGGGGPVDPGQVTNTTADNTADVVQKVLEVILGDDGDLQGQTRTAGAIRRSPEADTRQQVSVTIGCNTGQVAFTGDATTVERGTVEDFTIGGIVTFSSCDGINGALTLDSAGTIDGNRITVAVTLNDSVTATAELCTTTFTDFSLNTTANSSGIITSPIIANGVVRGTCDGESITCTVNNVDIDDRAAFADSCKED